MSKIVCIHTLIKFVLEFNIFIKTETCTYDFVIFKTKSKLKLLQDQDQNIMLHYLL